MTEQALSTNARAVPDQETLRRRRTIIVSLITSFLFLAITAVFVPQLLTSETPNYWGLLITAPIIAIGLTCALLAARNQATIAGYLLLGTILILSLGSPVVGRGQGVSIGILVTILGIGVAANTLPTQHINRAIAMSILAGVAVIMIDQFIPDFGLESDPVYTNVSAAVILIVFLVVSAQRFQTFTLRAKLIISFAVVMILPLLILGIYNNQLATQALTEESQDQLAVLSSRAAQLYDDFFTTQRNEINTEAKQTALVDYLSLPESTRRGSLEASKALQTLLSFQGKENMSNAFIASYAILDRSGTNILDTSMERLGRDESSEPYFSAALQGDQPYISNVLFRDDGGRFYLSSPIKNNNGHVLGVLRAEYDVQILQSLAQSLRSTDPDVVVTIVDRDTYLRLVHTQEPELLLTSYRNFTELELAAFQASGKMPAVPSEQILADTNDSVVSGISKLESEPFFEAHVNSIDSDTINTGKHLSTQPWTVISYESVASNREAIRQQTRETIFISLALAGLAILLAFAASNILAAPLVSLTRVAEEISAGNIAARATVETEDEIGALANSFNRMTDKINQTLSTLEERVAERTADLEIARQQSEKRANELGSIGEISKVISGEQKLESLLPLIARLVTERFDFHHTGIFLLDDTGQFAVLQAASSEGGRRMLDQGHRLGMGEGGIVGYVAKYGTARIALDVGQDAVSFDSPELPNTRSEMGLPLNARGRTLGVLDVQSEKPGAFTEGDAKTLSILADQIAIAIENARLFQQTQQALNEFQALYRQNLKEGWSAFSREESLIGYQQTLTGGKKLLKPVETEEIRDAINRGQVLVTQPQADDDDSFIVVPVRLRGQIIGTLKVQAPSKNRTWTQDEINLTNAVSERLSLALENARLIQESQKQVIKEQTITDVTSKIGASIDLKNVLQTAVEELGRAMPGSEVMIRFDSNGKK
jgi:GAF domain-containing protein/HAMP domain-containing protein